MPTLNGDVNGQVTKRFLQMQAWLSAILPGQMDYLLPVSGDASFRHYYRVRSGQQSFIVMDAPPDKEDCFPFVQIAGGLAQLGVNTPEVNYADFDEGFLVISDFGDRLYLNELNSENAHSLYSKAFDALQMIQHCQAIPHYQLPEYSAAILRQEMSLFDAWYLSAYLNVSLTSQDMKALDVTRQHLIDVALSQPRVCVHRDYHSRNLMVVDGNTPGVLDFQDAVWGPVTYDLVSLLRDCYIDWSQQQVEFWALEYHQRLLDEKKLQNCSAQQFMYWFDCMGLQRHLKCIGLFPRLSIRDNKSGYLQYMRRIINYAMQVCQRYPELKMLENIIKRYASKNATVES